MKILIIEDDKKIANYLSAGLMESGYSVDVALNGEDGLNLSHESNPDLILLDIMLPKIDGFQIIQELRKNNIHTPLIVISAKDESEDRIDGLRFGADDYLTKPFSFTELLLRIQIQLKRGGKVSSFKELQFEDIRMSIEKREVLRGKNKIDLHIKEFQLLEYFLLNPERVLTKTQILEKIWGYDFDPQTNVVDVLVCRLRNKIDKDFNLKTIHTVRGMGYVFKKG